MNKIAAFVNDYLASRGYPMTDHNRNVVTEAAKQCNELPRGALFRCLDIALKVLRAS